MANKTKPNSGSYLEPDTTKSIIPVKAFWQARKSQDLSCDACIPYMAIDKIGGELTCRICGYQTYGEKRMKTHIGVSN